MWWTSSLPRDRLQLPVRREPFFDHQKVDSLLEKRDEIAADEGHGRVSERVQHGLSTEYYHHIIIIVNTMWRKLLHSGFHAPKAVAYHEPTVM